MRGNIMTRLIAYDKNGNYVDSITTNNKEDIVNFYSDFNKCNIIEVK